MLSWKNVPYKRSTIGSRIAPHILRWLFVAKLSKCGAGYFQEYKPVSATLTIYEREYIAVSEASKHLKDSATIHRTITTNEGADELAKLGTTLIPPPSSQSYLWKEQSTYSPNYGYKHRDFQDKHWSQLLCLPSAPSSVFESKVCVLCSQPKLDKAYLPA